MPVTTLTTVMIVDDHSIMRDGLKEVLEGSGNFEVVGQAQDGLVAVDVAQSVKPDVVIMDVMMPVKDGIEACREIREALPDTRVLILTASTDEDAVLAAVAAGATGYLQKLSGKERLLSTIQEVAAGEFSIPGDLTRRVFDRIRSAPPGDGKPRHDGLTERERQILTLFAQGLSYAEIAEIRGNRPLTIRNAIYVIRGKIGAKSIQEMVVWAVRHGLLDDDPTQSPSPQDTRQT